MMKIAGIVSALLMMTSSVVTAAGNPFTGHCMYAQRHFTDQLATSIKKETDKTTLANLKKMQGLGSAVWMDTKANIARATEVLEDASKQSPIPLVTLIVYDLPNRDCHAKSSNGEICCSGKASAESGGCVYTGSECSAGLKDYQNNYIDKIAGILAKYPKVPIVLIIEPDSLPNFATNMDNPNCGSAATQQSYKEGVTYALKTLSAKCPHCTMYLDAGHGGWLGWADNMEKFVTLLATTMKMDFKKIRGFATNTANYQPIGKACAKWDQCVGTSGTASDPCCEDPCKLVSQYNYGHNEANFVGMMTKYFKPHFTPYFVIDTGRNAVTDMRKDCANWCNIKGAGAGQQPTTKTGITGVDAFHWLKTPGESDGCTETLPDGKKCPRFDSMCASSDSMPNAPQAGNWFDKTARELAKNAKLGSAEDESCAKKGAAGGGSSTPSKTTKKTSKKKTTKKKKKTTKKKGKKDL